MEAVEIRDMSYIIAVYKEKNFSRAAQKSYISQPALSKLVKKVERNIGVTIFDRSSSPLFPTPEGEIVIEYFEKILQMQQELREYCHSVYVRQDIDFKISAPSFFCTYVLPPIISSFEEEYPNYHIRMIEANDQDLRQFLSSGIVDVGIKVEDSQAPCKDSVVLNKDHIILAVPAEYEVNKALKAVVLSSEDVCLGKYKDKDCPVVSMDAFANERFLFLRRGNDMYQRGMRICKDAGFEPNIVMELDQMVTAYYLASAGEGAAFIRASIPFYAGGTDKVVFYKIDHPDMIRDVRIFYGKNYQISEKKTVFLEYIKQWSLID